MFNNNLGKCKIRYYTNIAPHYRRNLWELMLSDKEIDFDIFFGRNSKYNGIKEIDFTTEEFKEKRNKLHKIKNINVSKVLIYQTETIYDSIKNKPDVALFLGQINIISNWIAALIYKLKGVKIGFWVHGLYGKERYIKKQLILLFLKIADFYLCYNNYGNDLLIQNGINSKNAFVINNSLDYSKNIILRDKLSGIKKSDNLRFFNNPELVMLIFIGRLTFSKKLNLMIEALLKILNKDEIKYNFLIIGEGKARISLENMSAYGISNKFIKFTGELYEEEEIGKYLSLADLCVSPGNVGLTAIHSISYGTPVCTHNNFKNQMPEFESIVEGITGFFFKENDIFDLADKIKNWFNTKRNKEAIRKNCYDLIDKKYNPYFQLSVIKNCIYGKKN